MVEFCQMRRFFVSLLLLIFCLCASLPWPVSAQTEEPPLPSPYDLIAEVNALRAAKGLPRLVINGYLMASSQGYSDFLVNTGTSGHYANGTPDTRAAAAGYPMLSGVDIMECWAASSDGVDLTDIVYNAWGDSEHMNVMLNRHAVHVGAGISRDSEGQVFLILDVAGDFEGEIRRSTPMPTFDPNATLPPTGFEPTIPYDNPVVTSTQNPDGKLVHLVSPGDTAWSVATAYGISVAELNRLNGLGDTPVLYPGQKLLIRLAGTAGPTAAVSPSPSASPTPGPSLTPRPSATADSALITRLGRSPTPTLAAAQTASDPRRKQVGVVILVVSCVGLLAVGASSLLDRRKHS